VDLITALYFEWLKINPQKPLAKTRDYFILSKGHGCLGLYSVLALRGFFSKSHLETYFQDNTVLTGHPVLGSLPGIEASTGSLGHGFPTTIEMIVEKLNSIRSGRSFKDQNILAQMSTYFDDLNDNEKLALYAFLKGISQIVTGEISGEQAMDPQKTHPELEVTSKAEKQVHSIKPNIIKKPKAPSAPQSQENTTAPTPIVPKTR
jgi:hypothetical protein